MDGNTGEVALPEKLVQLVGSLRTLDEDDNLVELKIVQKFVQLPVLLRLAQLNIVLLEAVQRQLGVIVDVNLERVPHKDLANGPDLLGERGAKHHDLFIRRGCSENFLDIASHV